MLAKFLYSMSKPLFFFLFFLHPPGVKPRGPQKPVSKQQSTKWRKMLQKRQPAVSINLSRALPPKADDSLSVLSDYTQQLLQKRSPCSFFDSLPYEKRVELLKRTEGSFRFSREAARKISDELGVPKSHRIFHWMRAKCTKNLKAKKNPALSKEKQQVLKAEFRFSNKLDYGRALYLAHLLTLPVGVVQRWFNARKAEDAHPASPPPPKLTPFVVPSTSNG